MSDEKVTIKLGEEAVERLEETNVPQTILEDVFERHREVVEEGFHRSAVVSKREVPIRNGHFVVWGNWE